MRTVFAFVAAFAPSIALADGLPAPRPERCLAPPTDVAGDHAVVASAGLSYEDAAAAMSVALPAVVPCLGVEAPTHTLLLRFEVGCDGVPVAVEAIDTADWSAPVVACVTKTLRNADFPAHDQADGAVFEYPITFRR